MSITVTVTPNYAANAYDGTQRRIGILTISGLTAGSANTIPHGLPFTPQRISLRPGANGLWGETSPPDSLNVYVTVGAGGATAGSIDYGE